MAVFNDGHDNQEDYKADLAWEYRKGGPNDPETYEPVEDDQLDEWTDLEFMEALAEEYRETGRPWSAIRIERITKKLKELDETRYLIKAKNQKEAQAIFKEALRSARLGVALPAEVEIIPLDRPQGTWNITGEEGQCSLCKVKARLIYGVVYCPFCGARLTRKKVEK